MMQGRQAVQQSATCFRFHLALEVAVALAVALAVFSCSCICTSSCTSTQPSAVQRVLQCVHCAVQFKAIESSELKCDRVLQIRTLCLTFCRNRLMDLGSRKGEEEGQK